MNTSGLGSGWIRNCDLCGKEFRSFSHKQNVCSVDCRFLFYANKSSDDVCWLWSGPKVGDGYGRLFTENKGEDGKRKSVAAHRYSLEKHLGILVPADKCVMHSCDNPSCVNPLHLSVGSWADNNADRSNKGRSGRKTYSDEERVRYSNMLRGIGNANAKLTDAQARAIKYEHSGMSNRDVARLYGVAKSVASHIRTGRSWKHI